MVKSKNVNAEAEILEIIQKTLDDGKAEEILTIDLRGKTSIANEMVVATGNSDRHVIALSQHIQESLKKAGYKSASEGESKGDWVLIDAYDVIVHIFRQEVREFYNLEKMWTSVANMREK